jgi:tetratricopeptide (TPR) repeat protein
MPQPGAPAIPNGWDAGIQRQWDSGARHDAIRAVLDRLNAAGADKPAPLMFQAAYYLFLVGDYAGSATILEHRVQQAPDDLEALLNLAVSYSRGGRYAEAASRASAVLAREAGHVLALDTLAASLYRLGRFDEARAAGERALVAKDKAAKPVAADWRLPAGTPRDYARGKPDVIAYSLWGSQPRYLRGALRNLLLAPDVFPGWRVRFYVDDTVPAEFAQLAAQLDAEVVYEPANAMLRQKLCWRFKIAEDPQVGRFLVRDVDSVLGVREFLAVQAWVESDRWFHVIRDWWTHTELVLAGLWSGVAGVLPPLTAMLAGYASGRAETPNIDQWFLRDHVWGYLRHSCLVHDRLYRVLGSTPLPGPEPSGTYHVGQDEYAARRAQQARRLAAWIERYPWLGAPAA